MPRLSKSTAPFVPGTTIRLSLMLPTGRAAHGPSITASGRLIRIEARGSAKRLILDSETITLHNVAEARPSETDDASEAFESAFSAPPRVH